MNPSLRKGFIFGLPLVLFLALAVLLASRNGEDPSYLPSARLQQPVPAFSLSSLEDPERMLDPSIFQGQVSLLNVWATWCVSCLVEHPVLLNMAADGVRIIGVNYKDDRQAAQAYLRERGNPFAETVFDERGDLGLDLGVYGAPETYLIDAQGRIRYRAVGVLDAKAWLQELKPRYDAVRAESAGAK
jgi:cytochrome c biogenesis protein CcmG/thiol:disulfide interchange protein DsbE